MLKFILFIMFFPIAFPIWLISKIFGSMNNDEHDFLDDYDNNRKHINTKLEKEMDRYCLDDYEKDLVRKGEYNPEDFDMEDDDLEEDDYYYEDD